MSDRWLIVGLGNPGSEYSETRHNAGFIILNEIAQRKGCKINKAMFEGLVADVEVGSQRCILLEPQTYMNNSGFSVSKVANYYKIPLERLIVLQDDINFAIGKVKIRQAGSAGGHKGIGSIMEHLGADNFVRIKIGVNNKPSDDIDLKDWVLSKFTPQELADLKKCSSGILEILELIVNNQLDKAMNRFNGCDLLMNN